MSYRNLTHAYSRLALAVGVLLGGLAVQVAASPIAHAAATIA